MLIIKESTNQPSCVKPTSEQRLLAHGWIVPKFENTQIINHNGTTNIVTIGNDIPTINGTSNATVTNSLGTGIINPKVSSTNSNSLKLISIKMSPNPLRIGNNPVFSATFQNISGKTFYINEGMQTTLYSSIEPTSAVQEYPANKQILGVVTQRAIAPNETFTTISHSKKLDGYYQIIKPDLLSVTLDQYTTDTIHGWESAETIQFNVNVTQ